MEVAGGAGGGAGVVAGAVAEGNLLLGRKKKLGEGILSGVKTGYRERALPSLDSDSM